MAATVIAAGTSEAARGQTCAQFESHYGTTATYFGVGACCNDGVDNDGDNLIDRNDPGCTIETRFGPHPIFGAGAILGGYNACGDGFDNDGDGITDAGVTPAGDPDCDAELLCQDGFSNDTDGLADVADTDCNCLNPVFPYAASCTANDVSIAYGVNTNAIDGCVNSDDYAIAFLTANLRSTAQDKYDVGMWIALDETQTALSARTGALCTREILTPISTTPTVDNPTGLGPLLDQEAGADRCGDINQTLPDSIYRWTAPIRIKCMDFAPGNGMLDVSQCGTWGQSSGSLTCQSITNAGPGSPSKCNCENSSLNLPAPNVRSSCAQTFITDNGTPGVLDVNDVIQVTVSLSNSVSGCDQNPIVAPDPGEKLRCGTASNIRTVTGYDPALDTHGTFTVVAGSTNGSAAVDAGFDRLIWAPSNHLSPNSLAVIGPNPATGDPLPAAQTPRTFVFRYQKTSDSGSFPTTVNFTTNLYWSPATGTITAGNFTNLAGARIQNECTPAQGCGCTVSFSSTPVTLASFSASPVSADVVRFDWTTETEVGNVGFNVWAETPKGRVKLNDEPILAAGGGLDPQTYSETFVVPEDATHFEVEDLGVDGRNRVHGRLRVGEAVGQAPVEERIDWRPARSESRAAFTESARVASLRDDAQASVAPAADLKVAKSGLYRVTFEDLAAAGVDFSGRRSNELVLESGGQQVPIHVSGSGQFGAGSYIEFHGEALDTLYTKTNVYRLSAGAQNPARVRIDQTAVTPGVAVASYSATREGERNRGYAAESAIDDPFYDTRMMVGQNPASWPTYTFPIQVDGYAGGPVRLSVVAYGGTYRGHHVVASLNGAALGDIRFSDMTATTFTADVPAGVLVNGANTVTLRMPGDAGVLFDVVYVDRVEVSYPRVFSAVADQLAFTSAGTRFEVTDLASPVVVAYRRSGGAVTRLTRTEVVAAGSGYRAVIPVPRATKGETFGGSAEYFVAGEQGLLRPGIAPARAAVDLTSGAADLLVIAHGNFLGGIEPLAQQRRSEGLSVRVVDVADVYAQFGGGVFGAEAIQAYIARAYQTMGTRYVLLVGGDNFDYFNYFGTGAISFVPSRYMATGDIVRYSPSDSAYADLDGDAVPELAIGRLPVRTAGELAAVLDKIFSYETRDYESTGVFAADLTDATASAPFRSVSEEFAGLLGDDWDLQKAYPELDGLPIAKARLIDTINAGAALTSYVGHSGASSWGTLGTITGSFFTVADALALQNDGLPTAVVQWGCWNTYYVSPFRESLGTALLLSQGRGAAAVVGATTLTEDSSHAAFGEILMPLLDARGMALGDAIVESKQNLARTKPELLDVLYGWNLLGDPTMVIRW